MTSGWVYRIVPFGESVGRSEHEWDSYSLDRERIGGQTYLIEVKWAGAPDSEWRYYGTARSREEAERRIRFIADQDTSAGGRDEQGMTGPTSDIR